MSDENATPADHPEPHQPTPEPAAAAPAALPDTAEHVALPEHPADQTHAVVEETAHAPAAEARAEPEPEPAPAPEPEPEPTPESVAASSPEPELEPASMPEPVARAEEPIPAEPEAPTPTEEAPAPQPLAEAEPEPEPAAEPVTEPEPVAEAPAEAVPAAEAPPDAEPAPTPKRAPRKKKEKPAAEAEPESSVAVATETAEPAEGEAEAAAATEAAPTAPESTKKWYVVKVQSGREESIKAAIERKVKIEGLEEFFGQIAIPTEDVVEKKKVKAKVKDKKTGEVETVYQEKNVTKKRKKFPGYLFAEVDFNDRILYVFRETSGVGDFVGATHHRAPSPMLDHEVQSMLTGIAAPDPSKKKVKIKLDFDKGDKVRIREGAFSGMEGEVKAIPDVTDAASENTKITVVVSIFGRPVDVELDYWQVDKA